MVPTTVGNCPVREVDAGLFQDRPGLLGVNFPDTLTRIPEEIFDGSEQVRAIQVGPETAIPDPMAERYLIFTKGQDLGDGTLCWTWVYNDAVYGQTETGSYVLLDLSPGITEFIIPEQYGDHLVTYIHDNALSRVPELTSLTLPDDCGFSRSFYDAHVEEGLAVRVSPASMGKCLYYGYRVAEEINGLRAEAGLPEIQVSVPLTRMARERAAELEEQFGTTRPTLR